MDYLNKPIVHLGHVTLTSMSILVFLAGLCVAFLLTEFAARGTRRLLERRGVSPGTGFAVSRLVRYFVATVTLLVALSSSGVDLAAVFAASTVLMVGIGFGLQRIAQDFLAGLVLLFERPVQKGDFIQIRDTSGTVEFIGARATRVVTRDKVTLIVPNSELTNSVVMNFSSPPEAYRVRVAFAVAYGSRLDRVQEAARGAASGCSGVLSNPAPEVRFEKFGDSSLEFALLVFVQDPREDLRTASDLRFALSRHLADAGLEVPFPQLDVRLRTSPPPAV